MKIEAKKVNVVSAKQNKLETLYNFFKNENLTKKQILQRLKDVDGLEWYRIGHFPDEDSRMAAKDYTPIIEKNGDKGGIITEIDRNACDAAIHLEWVKNGSKEGDKDLSDIEVSEKWFGVPREGLHKMPEKKRKALAQRVATMSIFPNYTLDCRDNGIGQLPEDFPHTLLSLLEGNKKEFRSMTGRYGWGAGSSFWIGFCDVTLIVSKRYKSDKIGFTAIIHLPKTNGGKGEDYYYFLIDGKIPEIKDDSFTHGTLRRHYSVHIRDKIKKGEKSQEGTSASVSLYTLLRYKNATTRLPFILINHFIKDALKEKKAETKEQVIYGVRDSIINAHRKYKNRILYYNSIAQEVDGLEGTITVFYAVATNTSDEKASKVRSYVDPGKPIIFAETGQSRGETGIGQRIKNAALLSYVAPRLIIVVSLDNLSERSHRKILPSTRESVEPVTQEKIKNIIADVLESDPKIIKLNKKIQDEQLGKEQEKRKEKCDKNLARFLGRIDQVVDVKEKIVTVEGADDFDFEDELENKDTPKIETHEPPTRLDFARNLSVQDENIKTVKLFENVGTSITCTTDATKDYIDTVDPDKSLICVRASNPNIKCQLREIKENGRFLIHCKSPKDTVLNEEGIITVSILVSKTGICHLKDTVKYQFVGKRDIKEKEKRKKDNATIPNVRITPVDPNIDTQRWDSLQEIDCFREINQKELMKKVSYWVKQSTDGKNLPVLDVYYNCRHPKFNKIILDYEKRNLNGKRDLFIERFQRELLNIVTIQFVNPTYSKPEISNEECSQEIEEMDYYHCNSVFLYICHNAAENVKSDYSKKSANPKL